MEEICLLAEREAPAARSDVCFKILKGKPSTLLHCKNSGQVGHSLDGLLNFMKDSSLQNVIILFFESPLYSHQVSAKNLIYRPQTPSTGKIFLVCMLSFLT